MGKKRGNESSSAQKEDETIDATNPGSETVSGDKVADGDLITKEAVDAEKTEFPDSSDLEPKKKTPKTGDGPRRSQRVKTPTTHFGSEKAKSVVLHDSLSGTKKKKAAKDKQAIVIDFNLENKKQEEAKDKQSTTVIDDKDDTVDTANACPETIGEKVASYTDLNLVTVDPVVNPAEDEKKEEAKGEKTIVNVEMTKSPDSSGSQPKKKAAKIVDGPTRRSIRVKTPTAPFGAEKEKPVVPFDSTAVDVDKEEAKGEQAIAANGNEDTPLEADLETQSAGKIQLKDTNPQKAQPEPMEVQQDGTKQAALSDIHTPRALIEYKDTAWPIEASPSSLDYKALYIKSQKRVEELEAQNLQLVKDCEFVKGKLDAYKELLLIAHQGKATDAPATSNAKKQKRKN